MDKLPYEIKLTYIIAIIVMMLFVAFIIAVVFIYNKKQVIQVQEQKLKEAAHNNELLQKELERQKAIQQERERISHDMHDDLGAGISAIKLQAEFLKQRLPDDFLKEDVEDILRTSEHMNISMREMLWSLNTNNDTLESFIQYTSLYAESFFKKTTVSVICENQGIIFETTIAAAVRRNLFLCVKEALNNVCKHSQASQVILRFKQEEGKFNFEIMDNGIGFDNDTSNGNGLSNMRYRMESIGGKFSVVSLPLETRLQFEVLV